MFKSFNAVVALVVFLALSSIASAQVIPLDQKSWYVKSEVGAAPPLWNGSEWVNNTGLQNPAGNACMAQSDANCYTFTVPGAAAIWEVRIRDGNGATLADVALMNGADIAITELALEVISANYFWDIVDANFTPILGDELSREVFAVTNKASFHMSFGYAYDATSLEWRRLNVLNTNADGQALGENALVVASYLYGYNGATMDLLRVGAVGELQTTDVAVRPGEDAANARRKTEKNETAVYNPAKEITLAIPTALQTVWESTYVLNLPTWMVWVDNTGANPLTDLDIDVSPDGITWLTFTWGALPSYVENSGCANNLASGIICYLRILGPAPFKYVRVRAAAADINQTNLDVWVHGNKN